MIRSTRIPPILNRICDDVVHSALLVTADGELLGASTKRSTSSLFPPTTNNTSNNSTATTADHHNDMMDNLGTLIADIAVDYQRLGEEYVGIENNSNGGTSSSSSLQQQQQQQNQMSRGSSGNSSSAGNNANTMTTTSNTSVGNNTNTATINTHGKSQLQCLLVELELGLVAVSSCGSFDCLVIAIAAPNAPLGVVKAKIQTLAVYVQEALSPLAENT